MKLLVADDYPLEGQVIAHLLENNRPSITYIGQACSGNQALSMAEQFLPDISIFDIKMPGIDGLTLLKTLKTSHPWMKIIILTAFDDFEYAQRAIHDGASDFFLKPVKPSVLLSSIDKLCNEIKEENTPASSSKGSSYSVALDYKPLIDKIQSGQAAESLRLLDGIWSAFQQKYGKNELALSTNAVEFASALLCSSTEENCCMTALKLAYRTLASDMAGASTSESVYQYLRGFVETAVKIFGNCSCDTGYEQVCRAKKLIELNLSNQEDITLDNIARELYLSPYYLSHLFKQKAGINFVDYLIDCRLDMAKLLLLTTSDTVESIAQKIGYSESNSFRRLFKKKIGMSPNAYRTTHSSKSKLSAAAAK